MNVFGYLARSRYLPDRRDLNRYFPGSAKGSLGSQLAHLFMVNMVKKCDFAVDFHTGSDTRVNMPQVRCDFEDPATYGMAMAFGAPVMIHSKLRPNSLRAAAVDIGLPMLVFEGGEALRFDQNSIEVGVRGLRNLANYLGMYGLQEPEVHPDPYRAMGSSWIRVKRGGVWHTDLKPGDRVEAKQPLGKVADIYGTVRSRCTAPHAGMIIGMTTSPQVNRGDAVLHLAVEHSVRRLDED